MDIVCCIPDINIQYDYKKTFDLIDADVDNITEDQVTDEYTHKLPITVSSIGSNGQTDHQMDVTFEYVQGLIVGFKTYNNDANIFVFEHSIDFADLPRINTSVLPDRPELIMSIGDKNYPFNSIMELDEFRAGLNFAKSLI